MVSHVLGVKGITLYDVHRQAAFCSPLRVPPHSLTRIRRAVHDNTICVTSNFCSSRELMSLTGLTVILKSNVCTTVVVL